MPIKIVPKRAGPKGYTAKPKKKDGSSSAVYRKKGGKTKK